MTSMDELLSDGSAGATYLSDNHCHTL